MSRVSVCMVISCSSRNCCGTRSSIDYLLKNKAPAMRTGWISFGGVQPRRMHGRGELFVIDLLPLALVITDKIARARGAIAAGALRAGRRDALVAERASRHQQSPPRAGDHLVGR